MKWRDSIKATSLLFHHNHISNLTSSCCVIAGRIHWASDLADAVVWARSIYAVSVGATHSCICTFVDIWEQQYHLTLWNYYKLKFTRNPHRLLNLHLRHISMLLCKELYQSFSTFSTFSTFETFSANNVNLTMWQCSNRCCESNCISDWHFLTF